MSCERARDLLWPPEKPRAADEAVVAARQHVEECPSCREFLDADRRWTERLHSVELPPAPPELRERIYETLAFERARANPELRAELAGGRSGVRAPWRASTGVTVSAAVVLIGGGLLLAGGPQRAPAPMGPESFQPVPVGAGFVEDFVRRAVQQERIVSSDPAAINRFLVRELGMPFRPHDFEGFRLVGAEICIVDAKRGVVILYERDGQTLYHYVLRVQQAETRPPLPSQVVPAEWPGRSGPSVIVWSSGSVQEALVGDLPEGRLLAFARGAGGAFSK